MPRSRLGVPHSRLGVTHSRLGVTQTGSRGLARGLVCHDPGLTSRERGFVRRVPGWNASIQAWYTMDQVSFTLVQARNVLTQARNALIEARFVADETWPVWARRGACACKCMWAAGLGSQSGMVDTPRVQATQGFVRLENGAAPHRAPFPGRCLLLGGRRTVILHRLIILRAVCRVRP